MQPNPILVGKNIRTLRTSFGEKQVDLGRALGVSNTAIANYEAGRGINADTIALIAQHYGVSSSDLTQGPLEPRDPKTIARDLTRNAQLLSRHLFRFFAGSAQEGSDFYRAYRTCNYLLTVASLENGFDFWRNELKWCIQVFTENLDGELALEAMVNYNSAVLLYWANLPDPDTLPVFECLLKSSGATDKDVAAMIVKANDARAQEGTPNKASFAQEFDDLVFDNLCDLRKDPAWTEYADLYAALLNFCGFAMPEYDIDTSVIVGMQMIYTQARLGSELALDFLGEFYEL